MKTDLYLLKRAVLLFPRAAYLDPASVRHARRKWLESVSLLRQSGKWILDHPVQRRA